MEKWSICRICLRNREGGMQQIITDQMEHRNLLNEIEECGGVKIDNLIESRMPNLICEKCVLLLRAASKFRTCCQRSDKLLRKILKQKEAKEKIMGETELISFDDYAEQLITAENECSNNDELVHFVVDSSDIMGETYIEEYFQDAISDNEIPNDFAETEQHINDNDTLDGDESNDMDLYNVIEEEQKEFITEKEQEQVITDEIICENNLNILGSEYEIVSKDAKVTHVKNLKTSNTSINSNVPKAVNRLTRKRGADKFVCSICGNVYNDKTKLNMHLRIHNKVKPHECEICHKSFAQTPQLSRHMNSHTGNRPYKCNYCTSSFADPSTLSKHIRIHTNERPYKCEKCGKGFAYTNVLKVHMMMHAGEKPYQCSYCKKQFSQLHHMKHHEKRHKETKQ